MLNIFICTNIIQLVSFYLFDNKQSYKNIKIIVINKSVKNSKLLESIKKFSIKFNFNYIKNTNDLLGFQGQKINLISRDRLNVEELDFVNKFTINEWFVVEDGIKDYMVDIKNLSKCKVLYLLIYLYELTFSKIRSIYHSLFTKNKRVFKYSLITKVPLICKNKKMSSSFINTIGNDHDNFINFKIIILGSIYNHLNNNYKIIYDFMVKSAKNLNIKMSEILYVPHPRLEKKDQDNIKKNYSWVVYEDDLMSDELLSCFNNKKIWSIGSSSFVYQRLIYKTKNCQVFHLNKPFIYKNLILFFKYSSISCYFKSIGIDLKVINKF